MKKQWLFGLTTASAALTTLLILIGCGGGGGPITGPETGPEPSPSAQFLQLLPAAQKDATYVGTAKCAECHANYHTDWQTTRHSQVNVGCEQCHGGGSVHAATPRKDNILTYPNITRTIVCGQCHGPTHSQWLQSRHAGVVEDVIEEGKHNPNTYVRTCFRCHSGTFRAQVVNGGLAKGQTPDQIHDAILAMTEEQLLAFTDDTKDSADCASCHNPHKKTENLTSEGNQAQLRFATSNQDTTGIAPGVPVKTYTTYNHVCASCHNGRGANPSDTALQTAPRPSMHDSNQHNMLLGISGVEGTGPVLRHGSHTEVPDQCVHCHIPQKRHTFTVSFDTSCAPCHTATDAAARATATRGEIQSSLLALRTRLERWAEQMFGSKPLWDYPALLSGGDPPITPPDQKLVPIEVKRARHNYYFVLRDKSFGIHNLFYARHLLNVANQQLDTLGVSRAAALPAPSRAQVEAILKADIRRASRADMSEL